MKNKISITIITLNEEQNIARCIDSVKSFADEIIVLDAFSTDKTVEICKEKKVHVLQREWKGYSNAKNFLNQQAKCDYIFSIDADEAPDELLQETILAEKEKGLSGVYSVNRLTNYCGKWIKYSGWYPDIKPRIFQKENAIWEGKYVHETLSFKDDSVPKLLLGHLLHYSYYSEDDHQKRADKYSVLTAQKMFYQGKKANILKPYLSAVGRFIAMFIVKKGFLDGKAGFTIARISAKSNILKYKELRRLHREKI